jgi:hypothetical protein
VVYRVDPTTQELKPLPDEKWKIGSHCLGAIFTLHCYSTVEVQKRSSSFRIKGAENIEVAFKAGSPERVSLYRFTANGKKREFDFEDNKKPIKGLPVEVTTFGERSYKLVPGFPLAPGEYAVIIAEEVYTFGVD